MDSTGGQAAGGHGDRAALGSLEAVERLPGARGQRGRTDYLGAIEERYQRLLDAELGRVRVRVRTAVPLAEAQREVLSAKLASALGGRHAVLEEVVDRALLGGLIAESGSMVLDASLDGQLERIRRRLSTG